jgi:hypothetical protein
MTKPSLPYETLNLLSRTIVSAHASTPSFILYCDRFAQSIARQRLGEHARNTLVDNNAAVEVSSM